MDNLIVAIIGAEAVGKSTFIQQILGLPRPPAVNSLRVSMELDHATHIATLVELRIDHVQLKPSQPIQWPKQSNGSTMPRPNAAVVLYDVMSEGSIRKLPQLVAALANAGLPAILGACKCDNPEDDWEVDADDLANHPFFKSCAGHYSISMDRPEASRVVLQGVIRSAIGRRRVVEEHAETVLRRRTQSAVNLEASKSNVSRPASGHSKYSPASSDLSILRASPYQRRGKDQPTQNSTTKPQPDEHAPQLDEKSAASAHAKGRCQKLTQNTRSLGTCSATDKLTPNSFLDVGEFDSSESDKCSDDVPILQRGDDAVIEKPVVAGVTFDELVDRLLAPQLSRVDNNFFHTFLCLYRKFAAPGELLSTIILRMNRVKDDKAAHYLTKTATQLRIIEVVAKWVSMYPGDFARPATRRTLEDFIKCLSTEPIFSIAAQEMRRNLHLNVIEDDDTGWANSDDLGGDENASGTLSKETSELLSRFAATRVESDSAEISGDSSRPPSDRGGSKFGGSLQFTSHEKYEREALLLEPSGHLPMNKFRYHIFMDIPDDDFADELTRIDWTMFSSIRVRDFVRYVSFSVAQRAECKSLRNVHRMIKHFNHIAKWVVNMILLRDKAKHRAQMLEKFMSIALKLRQLNNYNGLAAVLAGINGTAIHRLAQTHALVSADAQKRFARLVILMGTHRSHFAYRLAWENSSLPRIPFIPLHKRDLISADVGSKTLVGPGHDRINWKKFEVLGEILLPIMKSQGTAYPNLAKHDTARDLILGCRMPMDDEEIYQRSLQVESNSSRPAEPSSRKKFPWWGS